MPLQRFHGGLRLEGQRVYSTHAPIRACPLPAQLVLPLAPRHGETREPAVGPGDRVRRGDCLARAPDATAAPLLAPAAGRVLTIEPRDYADPGMCTGDCIVLATDPQADADQAWLAPLDPLRAAPHQLRLRLHQAGLLGLGGGSFPSAHKLEGEIGEVLINGVESEPWITCDDMLLRTRAEDVARGAELLRRIAGAATARIAIAEDMVVAGEALAAALACMAAPAPRLQRVPALYPQGSERQLVETLTGREVPRGGRPADLGLCVFNVATAAAAWRAVVRGEPLLSRVVTVTGPGMITPGNWEVRFGTPIAHLVACAGGYAPDAVRLLLGGPLTGTTLPHDDLPVLAGGNCVLALNAALAARPAAVPCIRCGECAGVCPARLQPQLLHAALHADAPGSLIDLGLDACIECGACDLVCPSHLPLTADFRGARHHLRSQERERRAADEARTRFEARAARLARQAEAQQRAHAQTRDTAASGAAVRAALDRARARRRSSEDDRA